MKITSKQVGQKLTVNLDNVTDKSGVLTTLESCANGQCACSTNEYEKVETMDIVPSEGAIQLNIEVKPGEVIDPACITECLEPESAD